MNIAAYTHDTGFRIVVKVAFSVLQRNGGHRQRSNFKLKFRSICALFIRWTSCESRAKSAVGSVVLLFPPATFSSPQHRLQLDLH